MAALLRFLLHQPLLILPPSNDEEIVLAVASPRARSHVAHFDKLPVRHIGWREAEVVPRCGRNIQARAVIGVWLRPFISENILKVISAKWPAIFPFRIRSAIPFANGKPAIFGIPTAPAPYCSYLNHGITSGASGLNLPFAVLCSTMLAHPSTTPSLIEKKTVGDGANRMYQSAKQIEVRN